jgi:branched-chain amino acid aminotransferase
MIVFLNGRLVPEKRATVSVFDRSFLYGDGLFETMRVFQGRLFRWRSHYARLRRGAKFLGIQIPFGELDLLEHAEKLVRRNKMADGLLRLTLSRGAGVRGYSPKGAKHPIVVMTLHPAPGLSGRPPVWKVVTSAFRLPAGEALAQYKTCNKLPQILARAEAEAQGADEALLLNTEGQAVEGSTSNLFWITRGTINTTPLAGGVLAGVTRRIVMELCAELGVRVKEARITPAQLRRADGVFFSLSSWGIVEAGRLDGQRLKRSALMRELQRRYRDLLRETKG